MGQMDFKFCEFFTNLVFFGSRRPLGLAQVFTKNPTQAEACGYQKSKNQES